MHISVYEYISIRIQIYQLAAQMFSYQHSGLVSSCSPATAPPQTFSQQHRGFVGSIAAQLVVAHLRLLVHPLLLELVELVQNVQIAFAERCYLLVSYILVQYILVYQRAVSPIRLRLRSSATYYMWQHGGLVSSIEAQLAAQRLSQQQRGLVSSIEAQLAAQRFSQQHRVLVSSIKVQLVAQRFSYLVVCRSVVQSLCYPKLRLALQLLRSEYLYFVLVK